MAQKRIGKKHTLLFYKRTMDRLWPPTLVLAVLLLGIWALSKFEIARVLHFQNDFLLQVAGVSSLALSLFAWVTRKMAYVRAASDHLKVITPFIRIHISYRRMRSMHPSNIMQLFPAGKLGWADRNYLGPFFNNTALVLELSSYPMPPRLLRVFLPRQMFSPHTRGLVLLVADWMALSTEVDSLSGAWLQEQTRRKPRLDQPAHMGGKRVW